VIYLSDRHPSSVLEFTTHQRVDHAALLHPVVKGSLTVTADSATAAARRAVALALEEPRGPVHLDLPADVAARPATLGEAEERPAVTPPPDEGAVERAAGMIRSARRPVVIAGLGCRAADGKWLRAFCEALPAPLLATYKAKGAIPDPHPLAMGVFTGGVLEEPLVGRADLIAAFGLDTVELIPRRWPYRAPVLSLARRATAPGYFTPAHEVVGDLGLILEDLAPRLRAQIRADWDLAELDRLRRERRRALEVPVPGLAPHRVVQLVRQLTPAGTIATVDAGAHMFPATAYWDAVEVGECLISNGLSTMGFGLPAAIAAALVHPDRRVVCFTGDGGLLMVAAELETAVRLRLPVLVVVFDDQALSLIQVKQEQRGHAGVALAHAGPDWTALGRAFGLATWAADDEPSLEAALVGALAADGPALIDARIDASGYRRTLEIVRGAPA
jgi:acetolactate synthase-1/2/3 large subunit